MAFAERLTLAIKELGFSKNSFSDKLGYKNNGLIYDYTKEGGTATQPGFEFFERLIQANTGINIEWLFTGEGDMIYKKHTAATKSDEAAVRELFKDLETLRAIAVNQTETILNLSRVIKGND